MLEDLFLFDYLPKLLLAIFCGSLIGLERELKEKPAGMRTYMLICAGATLFTIVGIHFTDNWEGISDPMRIAAQVVTGIGFLGAGTILFGKGHVSGLTSAAAIWMSAAIGLAIGIGLLVFSVVVTLLVIISLMLLGRVEYTLGLKGRRRYILTVSTKLESLESIQHLISKTGNRCNIVEIMGTGDKMQVRLECELSRTEKARFNRALTKISDDIEIKIE